MNTETKRMRMLVWVVGISLVLISCIGYVTYNVTYNTNATISYDPAQIYNAGKNTAVMIGASSYNLTKDGKKVAEGHSYDIECDHSNERHSIGIVTNTQGTVIRITGTFIPQETVIGDLQPVQEQLSQIKYQSNVRDMEIQTNLCPPDWF
jgi:hypothetical protein